MMITELGSIGEIVIRYMTYLVFHWHTVAVVLLLNSDQKHGFFMSVMA